MRPEGCEADLLRALAAMPFLDRLEMVSVTGWSRGAVYEAAAESWRRAGSAPRRSTPLTPFHRRGGFTSPQRGCAGSRTRRAVSPGERWCAPAPSPPSGGAA